jgi:hypothetical protein
MPMRAYRASTTHIASNLSLWIGISIAVTLACAIGVWQVPRSNVWGHLTALAGMFAGTLVMMRSQEGYVPPDYAVEDDYVPPAV